MRERWLETLIFLLSWIRSSSIKLHSLFHPLSLFRLNLFSVLPNESSSLYLYFFHEIKFPPIALISPRQGRLGEEGQNDYFDSEIFSLHDTQSQEGSNKCDNDSFDSWQNLEAFNGGYDLEINERAWTPRFNNIFLLTNTIMKINTSYILQHFKHAILSSSTDQPLTSITINFSTIIKI